MNQNIGRSFTNISYTSPLVVIILFILVLGTLLGIMHSNYVDNQKLSNDLLAERYSKIIELNLEGNVNFLNLLAIEFKEGNLPDSTFQDKVNSYLKNHPELINITWVDSNFTIKSVCPLKGNSHIIGLNIELPMPKKASRLAKEQKQIIYTAPFEAIQGKSSFEAWNPIFHNNKFMGLFAAVYSSNEVINTLIDIDTYSNSKFNLLNVNNVPITNFLNITTSTNIISNKKALTSLNNGLKLQIETKLGSPFTPQIIAIILLLSLLILGISYSIWKLKNTQLLLKSREVLLINQNKDLKIAKEKAEESDCLKSAFLANMSHEIRTPMNGILGFADLLKSPQLSGEKQQNYIEIIEKGGKRMLNIINNIISISKIESGTLEVHLEESNINEQIEYIYNFFKTEVETKGMQLSFINGLPTDEAFIVTDIEKVYAILTNLIKNAIKYSNEGSIVFGYTLQNKNELEFFVKDTGIGIPQNRTEAIFERFIQAEITDKMARQGAGLGLSISKAYVESLGGKIWVKSKEDVGSTFYFTLPFKNKPVQKIAELKTVKPEKENNKIKILIVEDDEVSEELITIILEEFSTETLKAKTGREAIEICRAISDIDLIMMDIQIPDINGYEATRQIRKFNKDVMIIAQTAFGLTNDREKFIEAGCNGYVKKPIIKDELLALVQNLIKRT